MRLDGDEGNSVVEVNTRGLPPGADNPYSNAFVAEATTFQTEREAIRTCAGASSRHWKVVNPHRTNRLGGPTAYRLVAGENTLPYAQPDCAVVRRAGFLTKHLWVTPYAEDEMFAAGEYPNQRGPDEADGLPAWTAADRPIADRDVVLWYTFGHTHIARPEDWPVMPVHSLGFMLRPDGFFERNPAMDVAPSESRESRCGRCA